MVIGGNIEEPREEQFDEWFKGFLRSRIKYQDFKDSLRMAYKAGYKQQYDDLAEHDLIKG